MGLGSVWVASKSAGVVTRLDPHSGNEQPINVGNGPSSIAVGGGSVWVTNGTDGTVSRIEPASNSVASTITFGAAPNGVTVSSDGRSLWVSNEQAGSLSRINAARGVVVQTIVTGNLPEGVALNRGALYVAVRGSGLAHRGGALIVESGSGFGTEAKNVDPAVVGFGAGWQVLMSTNDGLVTYKRAGGIAGASLVPDLATSLPMATNHGKTYTFQIRPGVRYSNGALVQPADFRRAIERVLTLQEAYSPSYWSGIVGAAACLKDPKHCDLSKGIVIGSNTVSFHLTAPDPEFLYKLAIPVADAVPANTPLQPRLPLPATGPYMISSYKQNVMTRLVRNPRFREWSAAAQPAGYPDKIVLRFGNYSEAASVRAVEKGSADLTFVGSTVPATMLALLRTRYSSQLHVNPYLGIQAVYLNTRVPPFNNLNARRAFSYAVDRNRIAQLAGGRDRVQPTCQVLPPDLRATIATAPTRLTQTQQGGTSGQTSPKRRNWSLLPGQRVKPSPSTAVKASSTRTRSSLISSQFSANSATKRSSRPCHRRTSLRSTSTRNKNGRRSPSAGKRTTRPQPASSSRH